MSRNGRRSAVTGLAAVFIFLLAALQARAAEKEPVEIKGDQVEYLQGEGKVVASGNVEAVYRDIKLTCDRATLYMETKDAYLEGHVRLVQLGGFLKGEQILYNFETKKGIVLQAEVEAGPWITRGEQAEKISADSFVHRDGYLTSCDFEEPHTRLQAKQVSVYLDDKVVLKNVVMYAGKVPVFYLPSYTHPLDDKRPRVTIVPGKSKEWGLFLLTSWRVYLHENLQGRFHVDYRERRDLATGLDLKYHLPAGGDGYFTEYYTNQRSLQRDRFYSKYTDPDDDKPTVEQERYRFQLRHLWEVDDYTRATLEVHRQHDATFNKDFFEREFEEGGGTNLPSYFQIIRTAPWYGLTFLINKRVNRFETVTQQLPFLSFNVRPIDIPWLPRFDQLLRWPRARQEGPVPRARYGWLYQSAYSFERSNVANARNGTEDALTTLDTQQEISYPMTLRWFNFRPFFRFRQTTFSRGIEDTSTLYRQAGSTGFEMSTKFFRVFPIQGNFWGIDIDKLRHVVTPALAYQYQGKPTLSADHFVRSDGLAKGNRLAPSIEHKFQTKQTEGGRQVTVDLARFTTAMPYDVEGASGAGGEWNDVVLDAELLPYSWLRVESDAAIDPHIGKFSTINADVVVQPGLSRGSYGGRRLGEVFNSDTGQADELPWAVGLGWRYQRNTSAQMTLETEFNLSKKWRVGAYQAVDVKRFATEDTALGPRTVKKINDVPEFEYRLRRDLHEWTAELVYGVRRDQGDVILLLFRLKAAPELPVDFSRSYHKPKAGRNFPKK